MGRSQNIEAKQIDPKNRSPLWLDIAAVGSVALGLIEVIVGSAGGSNALLANAFENLDNLTYGLDSVAARNEADRKKNHRLRRAAGLGICAATLVVEANSIYDIVAEQTPKINTDLTTLAVVSVALNGSFVFGLKKHADKGTTHRDAYRHAIIDTATSTAIVGSVIASNMGYPAVDSATAIGAGVATIIMTFPTKKRLEAADAAFAPAEQALDATPGCRKSEP